MTSAPAHWWQVIEARFSCCCIGSLIAGQTHACDTGSREHLNEFALAQTHNKQTLMFKVEKNPAEPVARRAVETASG
jgi:hypothetical protein